MGQVTRIDWAALSASSIAGHPFWLLCVVLLSAGRWLHYQVHNTLASYLSKWKVNSLYIRCFIFKLKLIILFVSHRDESLALRIPEMVSLLVLLYINQSCLRTGSWASHLLSLDKINPFSKNFRRWCKMRTQKALGLFREKINQYSRLLNELTVHYWDLSCLLADSFWFLT